MPSLPSRNPVEGVTLAMSLAEISAFALISYVAKHAHSAFLASRPMVYIGKLSYGIYIWHWLPLTVLWKALSISLVAHSERDTPVLVPDGRAVPAFRGRAHQALARTTLGLLPPELSRAPLSAGSLDASQNGGLEATRLSRSSTRGAPGTAR